MFVPRFIQQISTVSLVAAVCGSLSGCSSIRGGWNALMGAGDPPPMPARDETYSYYGPGRDQVVRNLFAPLHFAEGDAQVSAESRPRLKEISAWLEENKTSKLILAGFASDCPTEEFARQLGEQRAQAVRAELLDLGADPDRIATLSYGRDAAAAGQAAGAGRVEIAVVHGGS